MKVTLDGAAAGDLLAVLDALNAADTPYVLDIDFRDGRTARDVQVYGWTPADAEAGLLPVRVGRARELVRLHDVASVVVALG